MDAALADGPSTPPEAPRLPAVILVRPQEEGNIGSVARAMANMGLQRLILVEPAPILGGVARGFGVGGWPILDACERCASFDEAVQPFRRLVGTASARSRSLKHTPPISPRQLPTVLAADAPETETALVFGCESNGLRNDELERCHPVVTVPCAPQQPTLNLAQAVLLVAYELHVARSETASPLLSQKPIRALATVAEVDGMMQGVSDTLRQAGYDQDVIHRRMVRELGRVASRAELSGREARLVRRLLNRVRAAMKPEA